MSQRKRRRAFAAWLTLLGVCLHATTANAEVHRTGQWPDDAAEQVSLNFEGPRSKALRELAKAAGWSIIDKPGSPSFPEASDVVNVYVTNQPAAKVLDLLLNDGNYLVQRKGKLISISATSATSAVPPPAPAKRDAQNRTVLGSSAVVARNEAVKNLTVLGGSTELYGTVEGDVLVLGGSVTVHDGARVYGDVSVLGGEVELDRGARVDGDLSSAGGSIERAPGSIVKGEETALDSDDDNDEGEPDAEQHESWSFSALMRRLGSAVSRTALLYAFGCVLLAMAGGHMARMQHELAEHPWRAFVLGVVTFVGGLVGLIALCVTIIGIPVAILLVLVGALGVYAGMCAVLLELGALVLEDRTPSPYLHLAFGCAIYLVFSALPFIGWIATFAAVLCGLGLLISTRLAGLFSSRPRPTTSASP